MSYRLERDESIQSALRRIAQEQVDHAIREIEDESLELPQIVHQVRKRCKKLRGLIRLVRPHFEQTYAQENAWYRDTARPISFVRDAQVAVKTFDGLLAAYDDQIDPEAFRTIGDQLRAQRHDVYSRSDEVTERLDKVLTCLRKGRKRIDGWQLDAKGFDAVAGGLAQTFDRGRKAMRAAYADQTMQAFHEWRKRVKYHWYHARLLAPIWSDMMQPYAEQAHRLGEYLGDDHDLAVLRQMLHDEPETDGDEATLQACIGLIDRRRVVLQAQARPLGLRLYAESPKRLTKRFGRYWEAWHCSPDALA